MLDIMRMDCDSCPVQEVHCEGCVLAVLAQQPLTGAHTSATRGIDSVDERFPGQLGAAGDLVELDARERSVVTAFAATGLISAQEASGARALLEALPVWLPDPQSATG